MSIFDFYVAVFHEVVAHPIYLLTRIFPCFLGMFIVFKLIDFIFYYIALKKYCSDDDKGENDDD